MCQKVEKAFESPHFKNSTQTPEILIIYRNTQPHDNDKRDTISFYFEYYGFVTCPFV